ncbi:MAG: PEGA domain-containing protein, partial [Candidatus Omnitrophota bacterium]
MKLKRAGQFFVIMAALFMCGCATITTGRFQKVPVRSVPDGAQVRVSSGYQGVTPCVFNLQRNKKHVIEISKKGYTAVQVPLNRSLCWGTGWNILFGGGPVGLGVDMLTGAVCKLVPREVS